MVHIKVIKLIFIIYMCSIREVYVILFIFCGDRCTCAKRHFGLKAEHKCINILNNSVSV